MSVRDKYFEYFNPNPMQRTDACDCVIRALCAVTVLSWFDVLDKCIEVSKETGCMYNSKASIPYRCSKFNLKPMMVPRVKKGEKSMTVQDFCKSHPTGKYIIQTAHHEIGVVQGKYYDTVVNYGQKVYKFYELTTNNNEISEGRLNETISR